MKQIEQQTAPHPIHTADVVIHFDVPGPIGDLYVYLTKQQAHNLDQKLRDYLDEQE